MTIYPNEALAVLQFCKQQHYFLKLLLQKKKKRIGKTCYYSFFLYSYVLYILITVQNTEPMIASLHLFHNNFYLWIHLS